MTVTRWTPRPIAAVVGLDRRERVQVEREARDERLALAGLHLGDVAFVEDDPAHHLDVEHALVGLAHARLADGRVGLEEEVVELLAVVEPLAELGGLRAQLGVGERLELGLERRDVRSLLLHALGAAALAEAEDPVEAFGTGHGYRVSAAVGAPAVSPRTTAGRPRPPRSRRRSVARASRARAARVPGSSRIRARRRRPGFARRPECVASSSSRPRTPGSSTRLDPPARPRHRPRARRRGGPLRPGRAAGAHAFDRGRQAVRRYPRRSSTTISSPDTRQTRSPRRSDLGGRRPSSRRPVRGPGAKPVDAAPSAGPGAASASAFPEPGIPPSRASRTWSGSRLPKSLKPVMSGAAPRLVPALLAVARHLTLEVVDQPVDRRPDVPGGIRVPVASARFVKIVPAATCCVGSDGFFSAINSTSTWVSDGQLLVELRELRLGVLTDGRGDLERSFPSPEAALRPPWWW